MFVTVVTSTFNINDLKTNIDITKTRTQIRRETEPI